MSFSKSKHIFRIRKKELFTGQSKIILKNFGYEKGLLTVKKHFLRKIKSSRQKTIFYNLCSFGPKCKVAYKFHFYDSVVAFYVCFGSGLHHLKEIKILFLKYQGRT